MSVLYARRNGFHQLENGERASVREREETAVMSRARTY